MIIKSDKLYNSNPNLSIILPGPCNCKCKFCFWKEQKVCDAGNPDIFSVWEEC